VPFQRPRRTGDNAGRKVPEFLQDMAEVRTLSRKVFSLVVALILSTIGIPSVSGESMMILTIQLDTWGCALSSTSACDETSTMAAGRWGSEWYRTDNNKGTYGMPVTAGAVLGCVDFYAGYFRTREHNGTRTMDWQKPVSPHPNHYTMAAMFNYVLRNAGQSTGEFVLCSQTTELDQDGNVLYVGTYACDSHWMSPGDVVNFTLASPVARGPHLNNGEPIRFGDRVNQCVVVGPHGLPSLLINVGPLGQNVTLVPHD
jgi:hypothetical protein